MLLVIDNFDSFTYNVVQYLRELGAAVMVVQNDQITLAEIEALQPDGLILAPGPGRPQDAGITLAALRAWSGRRPVLGVCLGLQAIAEVFGGVIERAATPVHGKTSAVHHTGCGVFAGLPSPFAVARYHSLQVQDPPPEVLEVTAWTQAAGGERINIMGLRHRTLDVEGVQFHPESVASEWGHELFSNFLRRTRAGGAPR